METRTYNKDEAVQSLQRMAQSWIDADQKRTKTSLARAAEISESCVRRLLNDGVLPSNENLFKLASVLNPRPKTSEPEKANSQDIEFTLPYLAFEENAAKALPWTELAPKLNSQVKKLLFSKASTGVLSEQVIKNDFGQLGLKDANCLVNDGLLTWENGGFSVKKGLENVFFDSVSTKEITALAHQIYYKPECNINYSMLVAEGVDKTGYREVMKAHIEFHERITEIAKSNPGSIPLIVAGFMDTMTTESAFGEGGTNE